MPLTIRPVPIEPGSMAAWRPDNLASSRGGKSQCGEWCVGCMSGIGCSREREREKEPIRCDATGASMNSGNPDWRAHLSGSARRQSNQQHSRQASECFSAALALMEMGFWVLAPIFSEHSSGLPQHSTPALRLRSPVTAPVMAPVTPPGPGSTADCHPNGGRCHSVQPQAIIINLQRSGSRRVNRQRNNPTTSDCPATPRQRDRDDGCYFKIGLLSLHQSFHSPYEETPAKGSAAPLPLGNGRIVRVRLLASPILDLSLPRRLCISQISRRGAGYLA